MTKLTLSELSIIRWSLLDSIGSATFRLTKLRKASRGSVIDRKQMEEVNEHLKSLEATLSSVRYLIDEAEYALNAHIQRDAQ